MNLRDRVVRALNSDKNSHEFLLARKFVSELLSTSPICSLNEIPLNTLVELKEYQLEQEKRK